MTHREGTGGPRGILVNSVTFNHPNVDLGHSLYVISYYVHMYVWDPHISGLCVSVGVSVYTYRSGGGCCLDRGLWVCGVPGGCGCIHYRSVSAHQCRCRLYICTQVRVYTRIQGGRHPVPVRVVVVESPCLRFKTWGEVECDKETKREGNR